MELFYRELGGSGEPLVILHGMLGSSRNWITAGRDLGEAGYRVIAVDLRNHGSSPHAEPMDYEVMARDVAEWLDRMALGPVALLGHSMGGKTAMVLACREPSRVRRLVVVDIAPKDYRWVGHRHEFAAMRDLDLEHLASRAEAEMRMEGRVPDLGMRKFLTTNLERAESGDGWRWTVNLPAITAALPQLEKSPLRPGDRFEGPALFVVGGRSGYVNPAADREGILSHFPHATIRVLPSAGHNPHFDSRPDFVKAVLDHPALGAPDSSD